MKLVLFVLVAAYAVAQTRVDIRTQTFGYLPPTQTVERGEDDWCPSPIFSRSSDTTLSILPTSSNSPCYLHFSAMPVSVKEYRTPASVTVSGTASDLLFVYWKMVLTDPKLFVSAKNIQQLSCENCTLELRTEEAFPKASIIVGMYGIEAGKLSVSGHPIIGAHQVALAESTAMLVQYDPGAGYIFRLQAPVTPPTAAQQTEKLREAQVNLEVANTNALIRTMETATDPAARVVELDSKVKNLEQSLVRIESMIPAKDTDVTALRTNIERARKELEQYKGNLKQYVKEFADPQVEAITVQYQNLQRRVEESVNKLLVSPPTKPNSKCTAGEYSQDAKYKYECLQGLWYRFAIDSSWK